VPIETERLVLRRLAMGDLDEFVVLHRDPEAVRFVDALDRTCTCRYAFGAWRLHRVEIRAGVDNTRSRAIPERLGFTQEGVAREAKRAGGRSADQVVYAILATDRLVRDSLTRIVGCGSCFWGNHDPRGGC
jgi:hypothetical protein